MRKIIKYTILIDDFTGNKNVLKNSKKIDFTGTMNIVRTTINKSHQEIIAAGSITYLQIYLIFMFHTNENVQ